MSSKAAPKPSVAPNQTLYIQNLPEKLHKQDLRRELYLLFSTYGSVLDIVALKTPKMRGQAHITFKDIQTAAQAMRHLDGFEFFGRPMRISYAKSKSDFVAKLDGTFKIPSLNEATKTDSATPAIGEKGTALQQSIFSGAPGSAAQSLGQRLKRGRDENDEQSDAAMEEDEEDMEMDESDED